MRRLVLTLAMTLAMAAGLTPSCARADVLDDVGAGLDAVGDRLDGLWGLLGAAAPRAEKHDTPAPAPTFQMTPTLLAPRPLARLELEDMHAPSVALMPETVAAPAPLPEPSVEKALKKLFCVEYARNISGLSIFGDAKYWWARAKSLYVRAAHPVEQAVMVFATSARLKKGHVAVVTNIVSSREIRVEQANWMNKGEIDHATKVLDVSKKNDWSKVRVWDVPSHAYGARIYAISGFILNPVLRPAAPDIRQAANN